MAYSRIIITQSAVSGAAGTSRNDLLLFSGANAVTFTNDADGSLDVTSWEWVLIEKPLGSVSILAGATTATATLQPDTPGRYVVSLRVNGLGDATNGYSEIVASVPFLSLGTDYNSNALGDYNPPATFENFLANWGGNTQGAQPEIYKLFRTQRQIVLPALLGNCDGIRLPIQLPGCLTQTTSAGAAQIAGYSIPFDVASFPFVKSARFYAVFGYIDAGGADQTEVELYDETNAAQVGLLVTTSVLTYLTTPLGIGSGAGDLRNDGVTQYSLRIYLDGGGGADVAEVYDAGIILEIV